MQNNPFGHLLPQQPRQQAPMGDPIVAPAPPSERRAERDQQLQEVTTAQSLQVERERLRLAQQTEARQAAETERKNRVVDSGFDATEGERKAAAFLIRALGSNSAFEKSGVGPRSLIGQAARDTFPNATNYFTSEDRQVAESAQDEFIAASLRQDSGAAIPEEELERQRRIYFPMPGDGPEVIEQKRQARLRAIAGLEQSSGRLLDPTLAEWKRMSAGDPQAALDEALKGGASYDEMQVLARDLGVELDEETVMANIRYRDGGGTPGDFTRDPSGGGSDPLASSMFGEVGRAANAIGGVIGEAATFGLADEFGGIGGALGAALRGEDIAAGYERGAQAVTARNTAAREAVGPAGTLGLQLATGGAGGRAVNSLQAGLGAARRVVASGAPVTRQAIQRNLTGRAAGAGAVIGGVSGAAQGDTLAERGTNALSGAALGGALGAGGQIIGNRLANRAAPAAGNPNALEIIAEGERRGVPVMTTDVMPPQGAMGRYVKQTLPEKIPFTGMSGPRASQQEARQAAVRDLVEDFGGSTGREVFDVGGQPAAEIARLLTTQRAQRLESLTAAKNSVIDGVQGTVPTPRAVAAIDQQIAELSRLEVGEVAPVISKLQNWKSALLGETQRINTGILDASGQPIIREIPPQRTLRTIEDLRKVIGESFKDPNLAAVRTIGEKALNKIYGPLREDMGSFIAAQAGPGARARWSKANEELAAMAGELKSARFRNVLKDADMTPEAVSRILFSGGDSSVSDARRLVSNLDEAGKGRVRAALLQRAFETANTERGVSVERFLGNLDKLSGQIGVAFEGRDRAALVGMRRLLEATRRGAEAGANIRTGEQNLPAVMGVGATQALGVTGGVATLGVSGLIARLYESAPVRNALIGLGRSRPGSKQERQSLALVMRSSTPVVTAWRGNTTGAAVNDNMAGRLVAEDKQAQSDQ